MNPPAVVPTQQNSSSAFAQPVGVGVSVHNPIPPATNNNPMNTTNTHNPNNNSNNTHSNNNTNTNKHSKPRRNYRTAWTRPSVTGPAPSARCVHSTTVVGNIYVFGGYDG